MTFIRQGDIGYIEIDKLPKGVDAGFTEGTIFSGGSGGHNHDFKGGRFYPMEDENTIGYLEAKGTTLLHPEHGEGKTATKKGKIADGIYKVVRQVEQTHDGFKQVID